MTNAPERIWIEDEFGDGDEDQWTYGTWDVRNYRGYVVEYVRADIVQNLTAERDRLREALEQIAQWSEAYPTEVFPEPDFARAAAALASSGMSIDAVSASNMRHATNGVGKIARAALKGETP